MNYDHNGKVEISSISVPPTATLGVFRFDEVVQEL